MQQIDPDLLAFWADEPDNKAADAELDALEAEIGFELPLIYRKFQKEIGYKRCFFKNDKYQGGDTDGVITVIYDMSLNVVERQVSFRFVYPPDSVRRNQEIFARPMELSEDIGPRIPPQMLTIGGAAGKTDGQVLLNLGEKNFGTVWFWERFDATWGTSGNDMIGFLGNDVYDVLYKLKPHAD
jgi:SMI1 / KNR4 family (SUKH-1)